MSRNDATPDRLRARVFLLSLLFYKSKIVVVIGSGEKGKDRDPAAHDSKTSADVRVENRCKWGIGSGGRPVPLNKSYLSPVDSQVLLNLARRLVLEALDLAFLGVARADQWPLDERTALRLRHLKAVKARNPLETGKPDGAATD